MGRLRFVILILMALASGISFGQELDFKQVDSTSFSLYVKENWSQLGILADRADRAGFDYYYLNMRAGIAFYEMEQFDKATYYFERALANNSLSEEAREYLYWSYLYTDNPGEAYAVYKTLNKNTKLRVDKDYKQVKVVDFVYVDGGLKFSDNKKVGDNMTYINGGLNSRFTGIFSLFQAYTYTAQNLVWGGYTQHEYYIRPTFNFKKKWRLIFGAHYAGYNSKPDYRTSVYFESPPSQGFPPGGVFVDSTNYREYSIKGGFFQRDLVVQVTVSKRWKHFSLAPHFAVYSTWSAPDYREIKYDSTRVIERQGFNIIRDETTVTFSDEVVTENYNELQGMAGADIAYFTKRFMVGVDAFYVNPEGEKGGFTFVPYIRWQLFDKFSVFTYYVRKGAGYGISMFNGFQHINTKDKFARFSLTGNIKLAKKVNMFVTYQFESIEDGLSLGKYNLHGALLGLKVGF